MRLDKPIEKNYIDYRIFAKFGLLCIIPFIPFVFVSYLEADFAKLMSVSSYLTWHNIFELVSIIVSVSVFLVAYYSYEQTGQFRSIYLGSVFLTVALVDGFHTLSFKGMPDFLIANTTANRATTLWVISRIIAALGFICAGYNPKMKKKVSKNVFLVVPLCLSIGILITVTRFPDFLPLMYKEGVGLTELKKNLEVIIIVLFFVSCINSVKRYLKSGETLELVFAFSMVISIYSESAFMQYSSVYDIYNYLGHIYKFLAFFLIFRVIFINNIRKPYIELYDAKQELKNYADNLDSIVQTRTKELRKLNDQLMEDLRYAKDIQKAVYPSRLPQSRKVAFEAEYFPAEIVSGDFYNIFVRDEENIAFFIGDVSGHGVPAAMLTVFVNQTVKTLIEANSIIMDPSTVLSNIYKSFNKTNFNEELYIVMVYALYNIGKRELRYSSAGHNVEPILIKESGEVEEIDIKGFPICKLGEYINDQYIDTTLTLSPKDKILFYTDGLIEAQNAERDFYSKERLIELIKSNSQKSAKELKTLISDSLFEFTGGYALKDDVTFFVMEVNG